MALRLALAVDADGLRTRRLARVRHWLDRVSVLRDQTHPLGRRARRDLPKTSGLAEAHVEWALTHAFEVDATDEDLEVLVDGVVEAPAAHVLLSSNVFVGALRAIAVAMASSEQVSVRPSRREPLTASLLHAAAPDAFDLTEQLMPAPGDHVWAYGSDETITDLRRQYPPGVVLHGHGSGFGVLHVDRVTSLVDSDLDAMAIDVLAFDQRGCLSPRFVLLEANPEEARLFAQRLSAALTRLAPRLPPSPLEPMVASAVARHRETWRYLGEVFEGNGSLVTLDLEGLALGEPPVGRTVHVRPTRDALADLVGLGHAITAVGSRPDPDLGSSIQSRSPKARWSPYGFMQRPRLDGPVDRRTDPRGVVLPP